MSWEILDTVLVVYAIFLALILVVLWYLCDASYLKKHPSSKGKQRSQNKTGTRKRMTGATAKFFAYRRTEVAWPKSQDVNSEPIPQKAKIVKVQPVEHTPVSKMKESTLPSPRHDQQVTSRRSSSLTKSACNHSKEKRKPHIKQSQQTQTGSSPVTKSKSPVPLKAGSTGPHESSSSLTKSACNHSEKKGKPHIKQSQQTQTGSSPATKSKSPVPLKASSTGPHESSSSLTKSACNHSEEKGKPHIKQSQQTQTGSSPATKSKSPVPLKANSTGSHESSSSLTKSACNHSEEKGKPHIKQLQQTQTGSSPATRSISPVPLKANSTGSHESSSSLTKSACNHSEEKGKPHVKKSQQTQTGSSPATKSKSPVPLKASSTGPHENSVQLLHAEQDITRKKGMPIYYMIVAYCFILFSYSLL